MLTFSLDFLRFAEPDNIDRFGAFLPPADCVRDRLCTLPTPRTFLSSGLIRLTVDDINCAAARLDSDVS